MIVLLTLSLLILTVIVLILIIKQKWNSLITAFLIPFLLFNVAFSWYTVDDLWGQPQQGLPDSEFSILYQKVAKPVIYLLIIEQDKEYPVYRVIPWTKKDQEELEKGDRNTKAGKRMLAQKRNGRTDDQQLQIYEWDHKTHLPKNYKD